MTGGRLLSYWRQRWAKPSFSGQFLPYAQGRLAKAIDRVQRARLLQQRWFGPLAITLGLWLAGIAVQADYGASDQTVFCTVLFAAAFGLQRQAGPALALTLAGLSLVVSLRYLGWRVSETLPFGGWALALGLALWIAEVCAVLARAARWCGRHWPLMRAPVALPPSALDWPVVAAVVLCGESPAEHISLCLRDLLAQDWPRNRLLIRMVVPGHRPELARLAQGHDITVEVLDDGRAGRLHPRDGALGPAELIWLIRTPDTLPANLSRQCAGWFVHNPALGWLRPAPAQRWPVFAPRQLMPAQDMEWVRRSALPSVGSDLTALLTESQLRNAGQHEAWIVQPDSQDSCACVDAPLSAWGIGWRHASACILDVAEFYAPVARALWWLTPALVLMGHELPLRADPVALLAYGLPHLALARLADPAQEEAGRMTLAQWAREWWLEQLLIARTALSFLRTQLAQVLRRREGARDPGAALRSTTAVARLDATRTVLQLVALAAAGWMVAESSSNRWDPAYAVFAAWALYNLLLSLSVWASVKEHAWVLRAQETRRSLEATVRIADGVLLRATTRNFPQSLLQLTWAHRPAALPRPGTPVYLFVSFDGHELSVHATTRSVREHGLNVEISSRDLAEYRAFGQGVFSRGADWPHWLAPRHADLIVPEKWHAAFKGAVSLLYDLIIHRNVMQTLRERFRRGPTRDDTQHG